MSNNNNVKIEKDIDSTKSTDNSKQEDSENNSDENDIPDNKNSEKRIDQKEDVALQFGKKIEESFL